jgi:hypothetical protein
MTDPVLPIPRGRALRLVVDQVASQHRRRKGRRGSDAQGLYLEDKTTVIEAQILGQSQQRRGLKTSLAGLTKARSVYLATQWSGSLDRRTPVGKVSASEA